MVFRPSIEDPLTGVGERIAWGGNRSQKTGAKRAYTVSVAAMDVADNDTVRNAALTLKDVVVDILVDSAGIAGVPQQSTGKIDYASWARVLDVNTMGPLRVLEAFTDNLARSERRLVVTITSGMGSLADNTSPLNMVMRSAPIHLAPRGEVWAGEGGWQARALEPTPLLIRSLRRHEARRVGGIVQAERAGGLEVDDELEFRRPARREYPQASRPAKSYARSSSRAGGSNTGPSVAVSTSVRRSRRRRGSMLPPGDDARQRPRAQRSQVNRIGALVIGNAGVQRVQKELREGLRELGRDAFICALRRAASASSRFSNTAPKSSVIQPPVWKWKFRR